MVVFRQQWLYWGKSGCFRAKVDVIEQAGCIRAKWMYSGKVVVFGQKWMYLGKSGCIRVKVVVIEKKCCIR